MQIAFYAAPSPGLALPATRQQVSARNCGVKWKIGPRLNAMPVHIDRDAMLAARRPNLSMELRRMISDSPLRSRGRKTLPMPLGRP